MGDTDSCASGKSRFDVKLTQQMNNTKYYFVVKGKLTCKLQPYIVVSLYFLHEKEYTTHSSCLWSYLSHMASGPPACIGVQGVGLTTFSGGDCIFVLKM